MKNNQSTNSHSTLLVNVPNEVDHVGLMESLSINELIQQEKKSDIKMIDIMRLDARTELNSRIDYSDLEDLEGLIIAVKGVQQAIICSRDKKTGRINIEEGFRRYFASVNLLKAGHEWARFIPVKFVLPLKEEDRLINHLIHNSGKKYSDVELGGIYFKLITNCGWTPKLVAEKFGKSESHISNLKNLYSVAIQEPSLIQSILKGEISATTVMQTVKKTKDAKKVKKMVEEGIEKAKLEGKKKATKDDITVLKDNVPTESKGGGRKHKEPNKAKLELLSEDVPETNSSHTSNYIGDSREYDIANEEIDSELSLDDKVEMLKAKIYSYSMTLLDELGTEFQSSKSKISKDIAGYAESIIVKNIK